MASERVSSISDFYFYCWSAAALVAGYTFVISKASFWLSLFNLADLAGRLSMRLSKIRAVYRRCRWAASYMTRDLLVIDGATRLSFGHSLRLFCFPWVKSGYFSTVDYFCIYIHVYFFKTLCFGLQFSQHKRFAPIQIFKIERPDEVPCVVRGKGVERMKNRETIAEGKGEERTR